VFVELMPLLGERTVMITVSRTSQNSIRVNSFLRERRKTRTLALQPLSAFSGTPEELDRELGSSLAFLCGRESSGFKLRSRKASPR